jgi:LuxR family maltose regulon positive regulatory protein
MVYNGKPQRTVCPEILTWYTDFARYFVIFHNQLGFLHNQIFRAAAAYQLNGLEQGCTALRKAFDMAREDHIILLFAEYAPAIIDRSGTWLVLIHGTHT